MSNVCADEIILFMKNTIENENLPNVDKREFDFSYEESIYRGGKKEIKIGNELKIFQNDKNYSIEEISNAINYLSRENLIIRKNGINAHICFTSEGWNYAKSLKN